VASAMQNVDVSEFRDRMPTPSSRATSGHVVGREVTRTKSARAGMQNP
jgi:hypothetical protein